MGCGYLSLSSTQYIFPGYLIRVIKQASGCWAWHAHFLRGGILTHWGRVTHICVGKLSIIGSDNGLSPGRRQAILWTKAGMLLIGPLGTNFSEIVVCEMAAILSRPQCVNPLRIDKSQEYKINSIMPGHGNHRDRENSPSGRKTGIKMWK